MTNIAVKEATVLGNGWWETPLRPTPHCVENVIISD